METTFDSIFTDAGARAVNPGENRIIQPARAAAAPRPVDLNSVKVQVTDTSKMDAIQAAAARRADFAATVAAVEAASGGKSAPKAAEPELTAEQKIAAWDAEQRAAGNQKAQTVADVADNYMPEQGAAPPGVNAPHHEKIAYQRSEVARMQRIFDGTERPRNRLELDITNKAREAAGLLPIETVPRKNVDRDAYSSADDLIGLGVVVPVLGAPQRDSSRGDPAELARVDAHHRPNEAMTSEARALYERDLRAVHDGIQRGESMDEFRARMLKSGTVEQKAAWTDGDRQDEIGQTVPGPMSLWIKSATERAERIGDPRIMQLLQLAVVHVEDGLRIAEFADTRGDFDKFLAAVEKGEATWTPELDKEIAAMRGAAFRATERVKLDGEQVADLLKTAKAPDEAREVVAAFVAGRHMDKTACTAAEHLPAELRSGYDLSMLKGLKVFVPGTLSELAEARAAGMDQAAVTRIIRQRIAAGDYERA